MLLRALGYTALGDNGGGLDSTISFKTSIINLDRSGPQDPDKYDLEQVAFHEINEALGWTSGISSPAGDPIGAADLFRFNGAGSRSFTTDPNENSYFSVDDGVTSLANFNQQSGGDYGDYNGVPPSVQDAFSTPGLQLNEGVAERNELDVIGYQLAGVPVPEPSTYGVIASLGLAGLVIAKRRRARA